jgi:hypothetical protein
MNWQEAFIISAVLVLSLWGATLLIDQRMNGAGAETLSFEDFFEWVYNLNPSGKESIVALSDGSRQFSISVNELYDTAIVPTKANYNYFDMPRQQGKVCIVNINETKEGTPEKTIDPLIVNLLDSARKIKYEQGEGITGIPVPVLKEGDIPLIATPEGYVSRVIRTGYVMGSADTRKVGQWQMFVWY